MHAKFFWSVFPRTRNVYGDLGAIASQSLHSLRIRENTDQKEPRILICFIWWK